MLFTTCIGAQMIQEVHGNDDENDLARKRTVKTRHLREMIPVIIAAVVVDVLVGYLAYSRVKHCVSKTDNGAILGLHFLLATFLSLPYILFSYVAGH